MNAWNQVTEKIQNSISNIFQKTQRPGLRQSNSMTDLNSSFNNLNTSTMSAGGSTNGGVGIGSTTANAYNFNRNQYQQTFLHQQQRGSQQQYNINTTQNNMRINNNQYNILGGQNKMNPNPILNPRSNQQLTHLGTAQQPRTQAGERPYMMFVYSQKFTVEGQGEYEIKITNVINPYTMKATPLQPSLIDPAYMMANGIGNNKKGLAITSDQLPQLIIQQNRIQTNAHKQQQQRRRKSSGSSADIDRIQYGSNTTRNNKNHNSNQTTAMAVRRTQLSGGAQVRMLACSRLYKKAAQNVNTITKFNSKNNALKNIAAQEEIRKKRMELGAKLFKKVLSNKMRDNFREIKTKSWKVYKYREQQKKKRGLQLFKFMVLMQDKQKNHKFFAMSKLKENNLSQIQEKSGQDSQNSTSQQNSKSNNNTQSYVKSLNPQDKYNYVSPTPTTAAQSFQAAPVNSSNNAKVSKEHQKSVKVITYYMERMVKDNQFAFWLPFRALQKKTNAYVKELKIDFGSKQFNREQLEQELARRFNKIEIKRVDNNNNNNQVTTMQQQITNKVNDDEDEKMQYQNYIKNQQLYGGYDDDTIDFGDSSKIIMDPTNFANMSAIQPHLFTQHSRMEDTFIQELQQLNSQRSRVGSRLSNDQSNRKTAEIQNFKPIFDENTFNQSPPRQPTLHQKHSSHHPLDASSFIVMEDDVKAIKIENNLANLNKDIMQVNDEIEQIKKLLFTTQNDYNEDVMGLGMEDQDEMFEFEPSNNNNNMMQKQLGFKQQFQNYQHNFLGTSPVQVKERNYNNNWNEDSFVLDDEYDQDTSSNLIKATNLNNSQIVESSPFLPLTAIKTNQQKRQLVPVNKINNKFKTEEEMIQYYELKALDHIDDNYDNQLTPFEEAKYEDELQTIMQGQLHKQKSQQNDNAAVIGRRDRSDSIKKNIQKYERNRRRNLNDSREHDFDGLDEEDFIGSDDML